MLRLPRQEEPMAMTGEYQEETFAELERRWEDQYELLDRLGEGTFGVVDKARSIQNGQICALKKIKVVQGADEEGVPSTAMREVALLKKLSHENVVELIDVFCSPTKLALVFEFVENDLKKYMRSLPNRQMEPRVIKSLSYQLNRGMEFCHKLRILHRDVKPQNLLITGDLRLKIADFGLARAYSVPVPRYTHEVVTVWYRAPEILLGSTLYSIPVDQWSVGCVMAEMASGAPLFAGDSEIDTIFKVFQKLGTPTVEQWPGLGDLPEFKANFPNWNARGWANIRNILAQVGDRGIDLLQQLMAYDPSQRISARRAMQHPYFNDVEPIPGNHIGAPRGIEGLQG